MAAIDPIFNGESGPAVRAKLNELIDTVNSGSTTINVGDAPLFDPDKAGGYEAGSIISYKNESSPDEEFHEFAIYIALTDISQGVSPEDSPNWKNEGATVEVAGGNTANGMVQNITRLRELTGMRTGHTVAVQAEGAIYVFDEGSEAGIKPFAPGIGSWVKRYEFSEMGGGHTILDPAGDTMPAQPALQFGSGFTVTDEVGKTVVGNEAASHIDGAAEEKHQTNQIYDDLTPLSTILPQLVNLADIDVSDINVGEKKIIVAEKNAQGDPVFSGGVGLLDVIANPGLSTLLAETNPNWIGDEITLTGNNLDGQLGENSQFFELDADFFLCIAHDNGTTTSNGSATWKRNRGTDSLSLSIPAHVTIINELEMEAGWNSVGQFKQITAKSKQGSWFRRSTGGYLYMCIDNSNGWTRVGTPPTTDLEITSTSHPVLTASLAAHDFSTNRFYVEGTDPADEPAEQGQEWWDTTNKYVYRRNMDGNWARING